MSKFITYKFLSEQFCRETWRLDKTPKKQRRDTNATLKKAMGQLMVTEIMHRLEGGILADESWWRMKTERHALFPASAEILDQLRQAKFNLKDERAVSLPYDCFMLAFPGGYRINGTLATGVLVNIRENTQEGRMRPFNTFLNDVLQTPPGFAEQFSINDAWMGMSSSTITISYSDPHEKDLRKGSMVRANIPTSVIPDILRCESLEEYRQVLPDFDDKAEFQFDLSDTESAYQFEIIKLIAAIGVYTHAVEDALVEGFPATQRPNIEGPLIPPMRDHTLRTAASIREHGPTAAFYRSWHFRQLRDARYYKGEHEKKPVGSRVVFVKDTYVGEKIEAETLQRGSTSPIGTTR